MSNIQPWFIYKELSCYFIKSEQELLDDYWTFPILGNSSLPTFNGIHMSLISVHNFSLFLSLVHYWFMSMGMIITKTVPCVHWLIAVQLMQVTLRVSHSRECNHSKSFGFGSKFQQSLCSGNDSIHYFFFFLRITSQWWRTQHHTQES